MAGKQRVHRGPLEQPGACAGVRGADAEAAGSGSVGSRSRRHGRRYAAFRWHTDEHVLLRADPVRGRAVGFDVFNLANGILSSEPFHLHQSRTQSLPKGDINGADPVRTQSLPKGDRADPVRGRAVGFDVFNLAGNQNSRGILDSDSRSIIDADT